MDASSDWHEQLVDIRIRDGLIQHISPKELVAEEGEQVIQQAGLYVSCGWVDIDVQLCDPGQEYREDWSSVCAAAAAGGFTDIACRHDCAPGLHTRALVQYAQQATAGQSTNIWPIGACMINGHLSEMMDMQHAGAIAFSNNGKYIADNGDMLRALQYTHSFGGLLISDPTDPHFAHEGQMHEGPISTSLGLRGIPAAAEIQAVERDLRLLEYTDARLHLMNLSCAESVTLVRGAKAKGLAVTASAAAMNLCYTQKNLQNFDTAFKVMPPLRTQKDRQALIQAVADGTIDTISCHHVPWDDEAKKTVFPEAEFGVATLETAFSLLRTHAPELALHILIDAWSTRARKIYQLPVHAIAEGQPARLTLFLPDAAITYNRNQLLTRAAASIGLDEPLKGSVFGVLNS